MHFRTMIHFESLTLINAGTLAGERWPGFMTIDFTRGKIEAHEFRQTDIETTTLLPLEAQADHVIWQDTRSFDGKWEPVRLFEPDTQTSR
ncbi:MAG: hypothetical protein KDI19_15880, partial [Pseudomonadales bacterium]|nr:hypothetical protein [Pseudomonadales bacterium]